MVSGLIERLVGKKYLRSPVLIAAFKEIVRAEFVPEKFETEAEADMPLPIGCGQTISQPTIVATMLELLDPQAGQHILDVGSGSGWTTALLGRVVGVEGKVIGLENFPELHEIGKKNIEKFGLVHSGIVECVQGDGNQGYAKYAPYDRILVSAAVDELPEALKKQLKVGGKMVIPIHNHLCYFEKRSEETLYREEYQGFSFIPLIQKSI